MEKNLEIKKLADIVVWADNLITSAGYNEEKYKEDRASAYCHVKAYELWKIKTAVLEGMDRHTVYTNTLNKDIADKAAKIDLLEKEIEGRKEGYVALKDKMTDLEETLEIRTKENRRLVKANEKLEKESDKWQDLAKMNRDTISDQYGVCEDFKKKIEELESEIERLNRYNKNLETANNNLVTRVASLESEIKSRKSAFNDLREEMATRYITIETHNDICKSYEEKIERQRENLNNINKTIETKTKENYNLISVKNNQEREIEAHESENKRLSEKIIELKKERDKHMARVNDLRMELDCLKASKEKHEEAARDKTIEDLRESFNYWRTQCLAAQDEIEKLKVDLIHEREKNEKLARAHAELENDMRKSYTEDEYGRAGFKRYIEHIIEEEEGKCKESLKVRLAKEIAAVFEEKEETEVKGEPCDSSDIPCGSDSIE